MVGRAQQWLSNYVPDHGQVGTKTEFIIILDSSRQLFVFDVLSD